jgi:hypothetical protein
VTKFVYRYPLASFKELGLSLKVVTFNNGVLERNAFMMASNAIIIGQLVLNQELMRIKKTILFCSYLYVSLI